jgi:hypothetical protein
MNKFKASVIIVLAILIAYQTYEIHQIEKRLDEAAKNGQFLADHAKANSQPA